MHPTVIPLSRSDDTKHHFGCVNSKGTRAFVKQTANGQAADGVVRDGQAPKKNPASSDGARGFPQTG
jgi:hypothetical protein